MKKTKGISLIVLVVTIIVMIIIAGAIILSLSESSVIDQAETAVQKHNESSEKDMLTLAWGEYMSASITNPAAELKVEGATVTGDNTNGWTVTFTSGSKYIVSAKGEITKDVVQEEPIDISGTYGYTGDENGRNFEYYVFNDDGTGKYAEYKEDEMAFTYTFEYGKNGTIMIEGEEYPFVIEVGRDNEGNIVNKVFCIEKYPNEVSAYSTNGVMGMQTNLDGREFTEIEGEYTSESLEKIYFENGKCWAIYSYYDEPWDCGNYFQIGNYIYRGENNNYYRGYQIIEDKLLDFTS